MAARLKKLGYASLVVILGGTILATSSHAWLENNFLFFPTGNQVGTPTDVGLAFEPVTFLASDGTELRGWFLPANPQAPVVLFCMGNYGNMSYRLQNLALIHQLGLNVFIFDYRGYGLSSGKTTEQGTYLDGRAALAWLKARGWPPERMVFFGRSLGAAVALQLALETPPAALILETPFTSIREMGKTHYSVLYALLGWLLNAQYDNLAKIASLNSPLLVIRGSQDRICPPHMAQTLFDRAPQPKQLYTIEGAGHNNTLSIGGESYWATWAAFLKGSFHTTGVEDRSWR
ncbi:MAG: alpha/beta hydrolase [Deltaproteobacteria bacterium]|jgi:fermentation-respiration switch protein FrsA (DUF1100 family)|nr:alpha/beta hydrolase [Deltaproteobacteria bacterium]MBW2477702.1 alpha/beta hydrolase [Deltaproteobacteria bacterium]